MVVALVGILAVFVTGRDSLGLEDGANPLAGPGAEAGARPIRVEVLNGAGIPGLARRITEQLRASGFDVVYYGNAGARAPDSTVVLDRGRDSAAVRRVADELGITSIEVVPDTTLYLEATVILGKDWIDSPE